MFNTSDPISKLFLTLFTHELFSFNFKFYYHFLLFRPPFPVEVIRFVRKVIRFAEESRRIRLVSKQSPLNSLYRILIVTSCLGCLICLKHNITSILSHSKHELDLPFHQITNQNISFLPLLLVSS